MNWKKKIICRILLIIAAMFSEDAETTEHIRNLHNHIQCMTEEEHDTI